MKFLSSNAKQVFEELFGLNHNHGAEIAVLKHCDQESMIGVEQSKNFVHLRM